MYLINPRTEWTPAVGDYLGLSPWQLEDLTPPELEAATAWAEARMEAPTL